MPTKYNRRIPRLVEQVILKAETLKEPSEKHGHLPTTSLFDSSAHQHCQMMSERIKVACPRSFINTGTGQWRSADIYSLGVVMK